MTNDIIALLTVTTIPQVINLIIKNDSIDEITAISKFYKSRTYELLTDINTDVWHFSPLTIYDMYNSEINTNKIDIPVEG